MAINSIDVVVGGQFGSESKGRVTEAVARRRRGEGKAVIGVRVAGPNAGHVVIDRKGNRLALRQVPVCVVDPLAQLMIAAGSEVDIGVLSDEIGMLESFGHGVRERLYIDEEATALEQQHITQETAYGITGRIGSTGKGIGAARADRIWRKAALVGDQGRMFSEWGNVCDTVKLLDSALASRVGYAVAIEGTQGFGLGLHAGYYPTCTSSDCRAIDFLAMAGISPWTYEERASLDVWVTLRPFPIRVAGASGPLAGETSWEALGLPQERTTVTQKVRRVGMWDPDLAAEAVRANGGSRARIALAMADQVIPTLAEISQWAGLPEQTELPLWELVASVCQDAGAAVYNIGTGPASTIWLPGEWIDRQQDLLEKAKGR